MAGLRGTRLTRSTTATERVDEELSQLTLTALVGQYRECSAQHMHGYALTRQVPAFTIGVSGVLVAATLGYDVPEVVRAIVAAVGAVFVGEPVLRLPARRVLRPPPRPELLVVVLLAGLCRRFGW